MLAVPFLLAQAPVHDTLAGAGITSFSCPGFEHFVAGPWPDKIALVRTRSGDEQSTSWVEVRDLKGKVLFETRLKRGWTTGFYDSKGIRHDFLESDCATTPSDQVSDFNPEHGSPMFTGQFQAMRTGVWTLVGPHGQVSDVLGKPFRTMVAGGYDGKTIAALRFDLKQPRLVSSTTPGAWNSCPIRFVPSGATFNREHVSLAIGDKGMCVFEANLPEDGQGASATPLFNSQRADGTGLYVANLHTGIARLVLRIPFPPHADQSTGDWLPVGFALYVPTASQRIWLPRGDRLYCINLPVLSAANNRRRSLTEHLKADLARKSGSFR